MPASTRTPARIASTTPAGGSLCSSSVSAPVEPATTANVESRSRWTASTAVSFAALDETATGVTNPRFCR